MITRFVEVTDGWMYGKFLVCRMDAEELATPSEMPDARHGERLLVHGGRRRFNDHSTLVIDLQLGTAAAWPLQGLMEAYESEHLWHLHVCPMYRPFVRWLYEQGRWAMGAGDITEIPRYLEVPNDRL